ncbi:MAG TPA: DNA-binding domain-containing protein [Polyangiaceae bacterium]
MTDLDEIQAFFAAQIRSRRALTRDSAISARADLLVKTSGALSAVERLEIYREQFWLRHTSSLVEDFPGVSGILGQQAWAALIEGYLEAHPPHSYTLRDLGLRLPQYIADQSTLEHHELCTDMARLELAYLEIFDAADVPPITPDALTGLSEEAWQGVRIGFHPALRVFKSAYPVAALRRQLIEAQSSAQRVRMPAPEPCWQLLFRRNLQLFHEPLSQGAYALLSALTRRVPLLAACEQAQAEVPSEGANTAESAGDWFQSWAARGLVTAVEP